jgi:hypothetical protein
MYLEPAMEEFEGEGEYSFSVSGPRAHRGRLLGEEADLLSGKPKMNLFMRLGMSNAQTLSHGNQTISLKELETGDCLKFAAAHVLGRYLRLQEKERVDGGGEKKAPEAEEEFITKSA